MLPPDRASTAPMSRVTFDHVNEHHCKVVKPQRAATECGQHTQNHGFIVS
jgi:hypothetical protein